MKNEKTILISAGYFNKTPCADNNIEIALAKEFIAEGYSCAVIGATYDVESDIVSVEGIRVYKIPYAKRIIVNGREAAKKQFKTDGKTRIPRKQKLIFGFKHPVYTVVLQMNKIPYFRDKMLSDYSKEVAKIVKDDGYHSLIGVVYSFEQTEKLFANINGIKKLYYQLDPFGLNEACTLDQRKLNVVREVETMTRADTVFTTNELYQKYKETAEYKSVVDKMIPLGFPTFNSDVRNANTQSAIQFDDNSINILFCGTIDDIHRNPVKTFEMLGQLMDRNPRITLHILGYFDSASGDKYIHDHKMNVFIHKAVAAETANATMANADFLLNIGNTDLNMVPSKIFNYFSTGKPIINIQRNEKSPATKYFASYPLAITLKEGEYTDSLYSFIIENWKKKADLHALQEIYQKNTPAYAVQKMIDCLEKMD